MGAPMEQAGALPPVGAVFALLVTASAAGIAKGVEIGIEPAEFDIIEDAIANADR